MSTQKSAKPSMVRLSELQPGEAGMFFARLVERSRGLTSTNKPLYKCRFRDSKRHVSTVLWEDGAYFADCEASWQIGQYFKIQGLYSVHERYGPQIEIHKIRSVEDRDKNDGFNVGDFQEQSRFNVDVMFVELRDLVASTIVDESLRKLTVGLLEQHAESLKKLPATPNRFYPFTGGWLEHVLNVTKNAIWLTDRYREHYPELKPPLNKDVVVAGAALHEIGCVVEYTLPEAIDALPTLSVDGHFLGHHMLNRDIVRAAIQAQGDVNPELQRLLEHVLLSYLTLPEWGSPRLPLIPEVLLVHYADDLDAKMEMYARCLQNDPSPNDFTERDPYLNRTLYKGRTM